jgi:hypothetical protein
VVEGIRRIQFGDRACILSYFRKKELGCKTTAKIVSAQVHFSEILVSLTSIAIIRRMLCWFDRPGTTTKPNFAFSYSSSVIVALKMIAAECILCCIVNSCRGMSWDIHKTRTYAKNNHINELNRWRFCCLLGCNIMESDRCFPKWKMTRIIVATGMRTSNVRVLCLLVYSFTCSGTR